MNVKCILLLISCLLCAVNSAADKIKITLEIPEIEATPYHRPYVAVWLETTERKALHSVLVWYELDDWLKDVRQWWRKAGRAKMYTDAVTGATRKPGIYQIEWDTRKQMKEAKEAIVAGDYFLNFEAAREEGGRDFIRQAITLGSEKKQSYTLKGEKELGLIEVVVN